MAGGRWGEPVRWGARGRDPQTQTWEQMGTESQPAGTRVRGEDTGVGMGGHQGSVSSLGRRAGVCCLTAWLPRQLSQKFCKVPTIL